MLGWSFETCLAPRKTRNASFNFPPVVLDALVFYVGLLTLFLNSHRSADASPRALLRSLGLWPRIAGSRGSLEISPRVTRVLSRMPTLRSSSGDRVIATPRSHLNRFQRWSNACKTIVWDMKTAFIQPVSWMKRFWRSVDRVVFSRSL